MLASVAVGQIMIPPHSAVYNGFSRGFNFTSSTDFFIVGLDLPLDAMQVGDTASYLVHVNGVSALHSVGNAGAIVTSIAIAPGDVVDIVGNWSPALTSNFSAHNSYGSAAPYATMIEGVPHTLNRIGWQWDIGDAAYLSGSMLSPGSGSVGRVLVHTTPPSGLFARFEATPTSGASPLIVQFTDNSISSDPGGVLTWAWDFDNDGTVDSTVQNPMHTYVNCGTFDVSLTVTDAVHSPSTELKNGFVTTDPVAASFTVAFLAPPGVYQFTDTSTPVPTAWAWDFDNDGTVDSTAQHPVFVSPGACLSTETSLTVTHSCSIDTVVESLFLAPSTLTGILAGGNGTASATQVGNLFDISVTNPQGINICGLTSTPYTSTGQRDIEVYLTEDTFVGKDADITQWRLVGTGSFVSTGGAFTAPTPHSYGLDAPIFVPNGNYGMAVFMADPVGTANVAYTNGPQGPFSNADLTMIVGGTGVAKTALFGGSTFSPRIWNGEVHYTLCSSSFEPGYGFYGTGCAGTAGVPSLTLQAGSAPRINTTLNVDVGNIPAAGVVIMTMGLSNTASIFGALPFDGTPFGAPGCFLRASPDVNTFLFGTPTATWSLALPNDPGLLCVQFFNQAFTLDTGANALGFVTSDAYSGIVGQ